MKLLINFINEFFTSFKAEDIDMFEKNLKIDILSIIKSHLEILLNPISLYCANSASYSIVNSILALSKKEPIYVMEEIYNKFNSLLNEKNKLQLHQIQKDKIFSTLQKIFEFIFSRIYQKTKEIIS